MKSMLGVELRKAIKTKGFLFSAAIGIVMAILQTMWFYNNVYCVNDELYIDVLGMDYMDDNYGNWFECGILEGWLGCETYSPYNQMFYIVFPLLATIPYGISLYNEWSSGYAGQMIVRSGRKIYLCGKLIAVFVSGGLAVVVPLLVSLLLAACYLPAIGVDPVSMQAVVTNRDMWANLYYEYPVVYASCYIVFDFIYGGLFAVLAMVSSKWFDNRFGILVFPLLVHCALYYGISNLFPQIRVYNPSVYLNPAQLSGTNVFLCIGIITLVLLIGQSLIYWFSNEKRDIIH